MSVNWVKARSECSLERVFHILAEIVDSDVKEANALQRRGVKFTITHEAANKLMVIRDRDLGGFNELLGVVFELRPENITVIKRAMNTQQQDQPLFTFIPNFDQDGECLVEIRGQEQPVRLWQVSRKGLEDLFFGF